MSKMSNIIELRKQHDQLYMSMHQFDKYPEYEEFDINFKPTYKGNKFDDGFFNKKDQAPSYTDRILFKNNTVNLTDSREIYFFGTYYGEVIIGQ